jgi:hypothetical protein
MPQANWVIIVHFGLLWGSVITSLAAGWRIPMPYYVSVPLGIIVFILGFLYNVSIVNRYRHGEEMHRLALARRGYQRIAARTIMNIGVALGFRSWLTLIIALLLIPVYTSAIRRRQRYLDYMRTGMLSDAFPDRIIKH